VEERGTEVVRLLTSRTRNLKKKKKLLKNAVNDNTDSPNKILAYAMFSFLRFTRRDVKLSLIVFRGLFYKVSKSRL